MATLPAEKALLTGCSELSLPEATAKELLRYLIVKRLIGEEQSSRLSSSSVLDRLLHWVLLNTDTRDVVEKHVGRIWHTTATAQQPDVQKMERRLQAMDLMAREGWHPTLSLWEEPGTRLSGLAQVDIFLEDSENLLVKYSCVGKPLSDILQQLESQGAKVSQVRQGVRLVRSSPAGARKRKAEAESVVSSAPDKKNADGETAAMNIIVMGLNGNEVHFKVQPIITMSRLLAVYASAKKLEQSSVRFVYDAKRLKPDDTPASLGMETDDVIFAILEQTGC